MVSKEMAQFIQCERSRCAELAIAVKNRFTGPESALFVRIINQISNGLVPERFDEQMSASAETNVAMPETVEEERLRCFECVQVNASGSSAAQAEALVELAIDIARG